MRYGREYRLYLSERVLATDIGLWWKLAKLLRWPDWIVMNAIEWPTTDEI